MLWSCTLVFAGLIAVVNAQCTTTNDLFRVDAILTSSVKALNDVTLTCSPRSFIIPSGYSWHRVNGNVPSRSSGQNTSTLTIHRVVPADEGEYYCMATLLGDCARSDNVTVTVEVITVTFNGSSYRVNEENGIVHLILLLSSPSSTNITIKLRDRQNSAKRDRDYAAGRYNATFYAGMTLTSVDINIINDNIFEGNESFTVTIMGNVLPNGVSRGTIHSATITIVDFASPIIVTQPTDTSAAAPFSGGFTCSVSGNGYQNITWYRQSGTLPTKHEVIKTISHGVITGILTIPNVTEADAGKYYCQVWANNIGVRSKTANLYYSGTPSKPTVAVLPDQQIELTVNNFTLLMKCLSYNMINVNFKWEKKNSKLPSKAQGVYSDQLTITKLSPKDSGEYRCIVSNSTGMIASDYSLVTIKVGLPVIVKQPRSTVAEIYNVAIFECTGRSYGSVSITWRRRNSNLPLTANVSTVTKSLNEIKSILRIEKSIGYYKGYYYCVIKNIAGTVSSTFAYCNITVPCPQMIVPPKAVIVRPNVTVTFSCLAWSFGGLVYRWNRNDSSTLPSSSSVFFQHKSFPADTNCFTNMYELRIINVQVTDEGLYCCEASNECGTIKKCAWLEVDTSPIITIQPKSQTLKDQERNVLALWIVVTGVGPIHYQWEKYDLFSNSWVLPSSRAESTKLLNLTFSVITEEDQGIYHCIVSNEDGHVVSYDANVIVYGSPVITYHSNGIIIFEGNKANLVCNATNDEDAIDPVQISWYKGTQLLKPDKNLTIYSKHDNITDQIYSVLVLDNLNITDDGEYCCRAFNNPLCYTENKINLTVEYAPRVTIDPPESPYMVNVGERLLLYCIAEGFPIPTIRWYEHNVLIPRQSSPFYLVSTNVPLTTVYTCEGRNNAGNMRNIVQANITIIIDERIKCPALSAPKNGSFYIILNGKAAVFTCNSGFVVIGKSYLECKNGKWTSPPPKCQTA